jgi:hypothetical protein
MYTVFFKGNHELKLVFLETNHDGHKNGDFYVNLYNVNLP